MAVEGKIVSCTTNAIQGVHCDTVLVSFDWEGSPLTKDFSSPFLNDENIKGWRQLMIFAIGGSALANSNLAVDDFEVYYENVIQKKVFVEYDGQDVIGIGAVPTNMFYPNAYGLWRTPQA